MRLGFLKDIPKILIEFQIIAVIIGFLLGVFGNEYITKWFFSPKIKIDFRQEEPFVIKSLKGTGRNVLFPFYQFRLSIYNDSQFYKVDKYFVMLTGLWHLVKGSYEKEKKFVPFRLKPLRSTPKIILPKMKVYAPFGKISHVNYQNRYEKGILSGNPDEPQFRFEMMDMPGWILSHVVPGKHRFEITVYLDRNPPVSKKFDLNWSGNWHDNYEEMIKQVVIKAL